MHLGSLLAKSIYDDFFSYIVVFTLCSNLYKIKYIC